MGATNFASIGIGKTIQEAFENARQRAYSEYGHQEGYSGTIYTKHNFVLVTDKTLALKAAQVLENKILDNDNEKTRSEVQDKWGPAGAIRLRTTSVRQIVKRNHFVWLFFGMAPC